MEDKLRCQSCGMPLGEGLFGTMKDKAVSKDYCKFCFSNGTFTVPDLTLEKMIDISIRHMMSELQFTREKATQLANDTIPQLKRWRK